MKLNEVLVLNVAAHPDEGGQFSPWIEIYNPTDAPVDAGGTPLSDDFADAEKWTIPCIPESVIPARGFLVIFADGDSADPKDLHANFTLTPDKPDLEILLNKGANSMHLDTTVSEPDVSVGRSPDGDGRLSAQASPTPGAPNAGPAPPKESQFIRGDANADGRHTISDMVAIVRVVEKKSPVPPCADRMDANDDGLITMDDALLVKDVVFQPSVTLPPPFPDPGVDPTPDSLPCRE